MVGPGGHYHRHATAVEHAVGSWASAEIFPGRSKSTFLLILFRLLTMQCKWTLTKLFDLPTPKTNALCWGSSPKNVLRWLQCFLSHSIKLRGILLSTVIVSVHYLPQMSAFNSHMQQKALLPGLPGPDGQKMTNCIQKKPNSFKKRQTS